MKSVLYCGCPASERADAQRVLAEAGMSVVWADTVASALGELLRHDMPVLLDLAQGTQALQLARDIRAGRASTLMFAVVDGQRPGVTTEAVLAGMADVLARPLRGRQVADAIVRELAYQSGRAGPVEGRSQEGRSLDLSSYELYSQSPSMREVTLLIARAASQRAGVIVRGEESTGRQVVARAIHDAQTSSRQGAFVPVDCAACDAGQLDAELFGAATRSIHGDQTSFELERVSRHSRLYEAREGTLYLQHVTEAPTRVQARLARVLRDREVVLVETGETISLDFRPMAGVEPAFDRAVEEARVREDLFHRLSLVRIDMPALRDRREDIPPLANCLLRRICARAGVPPKTISRPALALLAALPWRGNAGDLRALLESVVARPVGGPDVGLEDVLAHVRLDGGSVVFAAAGTLRQARARFERDYIAAALERHRGRISEAARSLGIQRTNLYKKMRALRVTPRRERQS